jgi:ribose transport system permease protein
LNSQALQRGTDEDGLLAPAGRKLEDAVDMELVRTASLTRNLLARYGLLLVTLPLIILFTIMLPSTFLTFLTFRSILSDQSIVALVSLAPLAANKFDLSVGYGIGLAHILSIGFQVETGLP